MLSDIVPDIWFHISIFFWFTQLDHFERANLQPAVKEALISQTRRVAAKLDADIEALYKVVD